jgi:hypothetical protein
MISCCRFFLNVYDTYLYGLCTVDKKWGWAVPAVSASWNARVSSCVYADVPYAFRVHMRTVDTSSSSAASAVSASRTAKLFTMYGRYTAGRTNTTTTITSAPLMSDPPPVPPLPPQTSSTATSGTRPWCCPSRTRWRSGGEVLVVAGTANSTLCAVVYGLGGDRGRRVGGGGHR